jgi:hypothetical protein
MEVLSHTEMTNRLGQEPKNWDFLGQVYDAGEDNKRVCVITQLPTRICFTIKPKRGKGRMTVSDAALPHFERWNPDLYIKLSTGLQFLTIHNKAVAQSFAEQKEISRLRASEKKYGEVKRAARGRIDRYKQTIKKGALPGYLQAMKDLLQSTAPYFETDESRALWFEQRTTKLETVLLNSPEEEIQTKPVVEPVAPAAATTPEPVSVTNDIPEIEF